MSSREIERSILLKLVREQALLFGLFAALLTWPILHAIEALRVL